jgi:hypothetical protein
VSGFRPPRVLAPVALASGRGWYETGAQRLFRTTLSLSGAAAPRDRPARASNHAENLTHSQNVSGSWLPRWLLPGGLADVPWQAGKVLCEKMRSAHFFTQYFPWGERRRREQTTYLV